MYYRTNIERTIEKEFLAFENVVAFTGTVVPDGVEADADGRKVAHRGSLLSESGKVVKVTMSGEAVSFSEEPAAILKEAVDDTYGEHPGEFRVEGYVIGERLPLGVEYTAAVGKAIHAKLPEIKFVGKEIT